MEVLQSFESNLPDLNHYTACLLRRIALDKDKISNFFQVKLNNIFSTHLPAHFYLQVAHFRIFYRVLTVDSVNTELKLFALDVVKEFFRRAQIDRYECFCIAFP